MTPPSIGAVRFSNMTVARRAWARKGAAIRTFRAAAGLRFTVIRAVLSAAARPMPFTWPRSPVKVRPFSNSTPTRNGSIQRAPYRA